VLELASVSWEGRDRRECAAELETDDCLFCSRGSKYGGQDYDWFKAKSQDPQQQDVPGVDQQSA
jgi:hypothetical protein